MKKILGLLVALCLIIGMLPMAVLADGSAENLTIGKAASFNRNTGSVDGYYLDAQGNQIPFGPAPFWYALSGKTSANWQESNDPKLVMNPGDPIKYFTTGATDSANPELTYLKETTDSANWNVKIEYPMGGTPTMTLKGANITNGCGIWYGCMSFRGVDAARKEQNTKLNKRNKST